MKRFRAIRTATRKMLIAGESDQVDFKRSVKGVDTEILVAFANTKIGGSVLVGVAEQKGPNGEQFGSPIGHDLSDETVVAIQSRALECIPPVTVKLFAEGTTDAPIIRIDIPPSATRPHCTSSGKYLIRKGARKSVLQPDELLEIFVEREAASFNNKFREATSEIEQTIAEFSSDIEDKIGEIGDTLGWSDYQLNDTASTIDSILAIVSKTHLYSQNVDKRVLSFLRSEHPNVDPVHRAAVKKLTEGLIEAIQKREKLRDLLANTGAVDLLKYDRHELVEAEVRAAIADAISEVDRSIGPVKGNQE